MTARQTNTSVCYLSLRETQLGDKGGEILAKGIQGSDCLTCVVFGGNDMGGCVRVSPHFPSAMPRGARGKG